LAARDIRVVIVVMGWDLFIHNKIKECEPVLLALVNPSWHLRGRSSQLQSARLVAAVAEPRSSGKTHEQLRIQCF
jgi:hypothetical protein